MKKYWLMLLLCSSAVANDGSPIENYNEEQSLHIDMQMVNSPLDDADSLTHMQLVEFALSNVIDNVVLKWDNIENGSNGSVDIIQTWDNSAYTCRTIISTVSNPKNHTSYKSTACFDMLSESWLYLY